jgi:hypothetical protein
VTNSKSAVPAPAVSHVIAFAFERKYDVNVSALMTYERGQTPSPAAMTIAIRLAEVYLGKAH